MSSLHFQASPWFVRNSLNPHAKFRLFCLPYAGGSASVFRTWIKHFPKTVDVCPIQLPGRGIRLGEPAFTDISPLVEALATAILPYLDKPFAFFGHSLGGLVAFELAHRLHLKTRHLPAHLFVSGTCPPRNIPARRVLSSLPENELLDELARLNGTPSELLENSEVMALMLPALRADFAIYENYRYAKTHPLACPITVFSGIQDHEVNQHRLDSWSEETCKRCSQHLLAGDHFFLHHSEAELIKLIQQYLNPLIHLSTNHKAIGATL